LAQTESGKKAGYLPCRTNWGFDGWGGWTRTNTVLINSGNFDVQHVHNVLSVQQNAFGGHKLHAVGGPIQMATVTLAEGFKRIYEQEIHQLLLKNQNCHGCLRANLRELILLPQLR
jgi:hypothetical protein